MAPREDPLETPGEEARQTLRTFKPTLGEDRHAFLAELDPHFASLYLAQWHGLFSRPGLDVRTRVLVLVGQYTMVNDIRSLSETVRAAAAREVDLKEVLEVIIQCHLYAGEAKVIAALEAFAEVADEVGKLDEVRSRGLSVDATADRSFEDEQARWSEADRQDPRLDKLMDKYDWRALSTAMHLRPGEQLRMFKDFYDVLDDDFTRLWLNVVYRGMYSRRVLDDRTRLICMVGDCTAVGEFTQGRQHMRGALRHGAKPRELLEVILQSTIVIGHPHTVGGAANDLVNLLAREGRLDEIIDEGELEEFKQAVEARQARRRSH